MENHSSKPDLDGAGALLARAAAAERRAGRRLGTIALDLAAADEDRLDDETRATMRAMLSRLIGAVAADLGHYARRQLPPAAEDRETLVDRLVGAGVLDEPLLAELLLRANEARIADRLAIEQPGDSGRSGLLPRLANSPDRLAAAASGALMAAEARRRGAGADAGRDDLPAELQHRLVWWTAAALRPADGSVALDAALADAAQRVLAAHDEGARMEAVAQRLAMALDDSPDDLSGILEEALADRRMALVAALIAHRLGIDLTLARTMLAEPDGDRLLLALRALDIPHETLARIAVALADADRRRSMTAVPDVVEAVMSVSPDEARGALATLRLPAGYRAALAALERAH
ncbi:MAG TPA: DUF2336 domain-containing protein [Sphingomonas sp.]|nr:DUF2336 domain-containing protein [Sphingomonas sp.]